MKPKAYPITAKNSTVNGDPGTHYDWSKFDWEGKTVHVDSCLHLNCDHKHEYKAYPAYTDGKVEEYYEYLHVPYDFAEDATVFRVRPHFAVSQKRWGHIIKAVRAKKIDGVWNWVISFASPQ